MDESKDPEPCAHGVVFEHTKSQELSSEQVREKYPRLSGLCPLGCGYVGIFYASFEHFAAGDW